MIYRYKKDIIYTMYIIIYYPRAPKNSSFFRKYDLCDWATWSVISLIKVCESVKVLSLDILKFINRVSSRAPPALRGIFGISSGYLRNKGRVFFRVKKIGNYIRVGTDLNDNFRQFRH